jgi:hypothetical protein
MSLATVQRGLSELIRTGATATDDPYVRGLVGSDQVALLREIVLWWRTFGVQRACPLTSRLLLRQGRLDQAVDDFAVANSISPYVDNLALAFVDANRHDDDPLVAAVASFEAALIRAKRGERERHVIAWPEEPYGVLAALLGDTPLPAASGTRAWTVVAADLPGRFQVVVEPPADLTDPDAAEPAGVRLHGVA